MKELCRSQTKFSAELLFFDMVIMKMLEKKWPIQNTLERNTITNCCELQEGSLTLYISCTVKTISHPEQPLGSVLSVLSQDKHCLLHLNLLLWSSRLGKFQHSKKKKKDLANSAVAQFLNSRDSCFNPAVIFSLAYAFRKTGTQHNSLTRLS